MADTNPPAQRLPRWQKRVMLALVAVVFVLVVVFWSRIGHDFWPPDRSFVGPNLLAAAVQALIVGLVVVLIWPPTRRRLHRFMDRKLEAVHTKLDDHITAVREHQQRQHEHNEWVARHVAETFRQTTGKDPDPHPHFEL